MMPELHWCVNMMNCICVCVSSFMCILQVSCVYIQFPMYISSFLCINPFSRVDIKLPVYIQYQVSFVYIKFPISEERNLDLIEKFPIIA